MKFNYRLGFINGSRQVPLSTLLGKTFLKIEPIDDDEGLAFLTKDQTFVIYHEQDCCEQVSLEEVIGDLQDLIGSPIIRAEELTNSDEAHPMDEDPESFTWTFYELATIKGSVTLRWYGSSNGYYSETADLYEVIDEN